MYDMSDKKLKELKEEISGREDMTINYKDLSFRDKVSHIWTYYRLLIIGSLIGLVIVISIGSAVTKNINTEILLDMTIISYGYDTDQADIIREDLTQMLTYEDGKKYQEVIVENISLMENQDPNAQMVNSSKLTAKLTAHQIDVLVMDIDNLESSARGDVLADLSAFLDIETLGIPEADLYYYNDVLVAVKVTDASYFDGLFLYEEDMYMGIYLYAPQIDHAKEVVSMILSQ